MKKKMNKIKILWLAILFLFITNVVTVISGLVLTSASKKADTTVPVFSAHERAGFYGDHLGLSPGQRNIFMRINKSYNRDARQTTARIESLRYRMIDEMAEEQPDKERLDTICHEIGNLHTRLKKSTVDYYLSLKDICTEDQQRRLHELFMGMADPQSDLNAFGRARGMQRGMNRGRGMMRMDTNDVNHLIREYY